MNRFHYHCIYLYISLPNYNMTSNILRSASDPAILPRCCMTIKLISQHVFQHLAFSLQGLVEVEAAGTGAVKVELRFGRDVVVEVEAATEVSEGGASDAVLLLLAKGLSPSGRSANSSLGPVSK
jgi:hypothetical protein